jgi:AraC-like DNA-binding protein
VRYQEYRVPPPLDALIECIWFLNAVHRHAPARQQVFPDGCMELVFHFGTPFAVTAGGARIQQPRSVLVGMMTRPLTLQPPMTIDTMGVRFRPGGAYPFAGVSLAAITDGSVELQDLWPASAASELFERLAAAPDEAARVTLATRALRDRLGKRADETVSAAVGHLVRTAGRVPVSAVTREAGVSQRHLQRRFAEQVGVGPKLLSRILRFQHTLRYRDPARGSVGTPVSTPLRAIDWARVALQCGYSDQPHLIRDYAQFTGTTPASLVAAESELSSYFTDPQRLARLFGARV